MNIRLKQWGSPRQPNTHILVWHQCDGPPGIWSNSVRIHAGVSSRSLLETIGIASSNTLALILEYRVHLIEVGPFADVGTPCSPHQRLDRSRPRFLDKRAFSFAIPHPGFKARHGIDLKGNLIGIHLPKYDTE